MDMDLQTEVRLFIKELDELIHSISLLNEARHQVRLQQADVQHARRIEQLLFETWLSPFTSVQQWFDAQSDDAKDYWRTLYVLYQYNPDYSAKFEELDFISQQVFELLRARDLYEQATIFEPVNHLLKSA